MQIAPVIVAMDRSAKLTEPVMTVSTRVVSVVNLDNTSPCANSFKIRRGEQGKPVKHGLTNICNHALAKPRDEEKPQGTDDCKDNGKNSCKYKIRSQRLIVLSGDGGANRH